MSDWQYSNYSKINSKVSNNFPFPNPRPGQLETVSEILEAIDKGYKYIVLEAGPGTGKSAIAACLTNFFEDSYILTVTKQLQNQYLRDFKNFKLVKGRNNFKCLMSENNCDLGRCLVEDFSCEFKKSIPPVCPYYEQKFHALNARTVVSNYHYMFLELNYVDDFHSRNLMICDEAHNLEQVLMNQLQLEFNRSELEEFLNFKVKDTFLKDLSSSNYNEWINFIEKIINLYTKKLENTHVGEDVVFIKNQISACRQFMVNIAFDSKNWIFNWDEEEELIQFKPVKINHYANQLLKHSNICVFMSATILDYELFAEYLGINPDEIYAIRKKSIFNVENNPLIPYGEYNLSKNLIGVNAPKTITEISEILNIHRNDKGIIHTVSNQCSDFIFENISDNRLIRPDDIEVFENSSKPLVLVSPALDEGVDFPGDLCRFQIIYKIPYLDLGDMQIKSRMKEDSEWYDYKTSLRLIQTHGRGMRDETDYCKTYVIDSRISSYILNNTYLPIEFKKALTPCDYDELIKKAEKSEFQGDYQNAIKIYNRIIKSTVNHEPYLRLAEIYKSLDLYEMEVNVIVKYLRTGSDNIDYFKKRLNVLEKYGYFDSKLFNTIL